MPILQSHLGLFDQYIEPFSFLLVEINVRGARSQSQHAGHHTVCLRVQRQQPIPVPYKKALLLPQRPFPGSAAIVRRLGNRPPLFHRPLYTVRF